MQSKVRPTAKTCIAAAIAAILFNGNAVAADQDLQSQIEELAKKLEVLQRQMQEQPAPSVKSGTPGSFELSLSGTVDVGVAIQGDIAPSNAVLKGNTVKFFNGGLAPSNFRISGSAGIHKDITAIFALDTEFLTSTGALLLPANGMVAPSSYNGLNGSPVLFNRDAYGGIKGSFGSLTLGRQLTPAVETTVKVDPSGYADFIMSSGYGAFGLGNSIFGLGLVNTAAGRYAPGVSGNLDSRDNGMVKYTSPVMSGLKIIAAYSPGAVAGDSSLGSKGAIGGSYDIGQFSMGGSYTKWKPVDAITSKGANYSVGNFGVGYKFGALTVRAAIGRTSLPSVTLKDPSNTNVTYSDATATVTGIGATYAATKNIDIVAAYYYKKYSIALNNEPAVSTLGLGLMYAVDPSTKIYAIFDEAKSRGDNGLNQTLGGHGSASAFAAGLKYSFDQRWKR
jgi:predicted porin